VMRPTPVMIPVNMGDIFAGLSAAYRPSRANILKSGPICVTS
jgi:hypothetical protein